MKLVSTGRCGILKELVRSVFVLECIDLSGIIDNLVTYHIVWWQKQNLSLLTAEGIKTYRF